MTVAVTRPVTNAVIAALTTAAPADVRVGDGRTPNGAGWQGDIGRSKFVGYVVVDVYPGGILDGDLADPYSDAEILIGVRSIGATRDHAELVADIARTTLLAAGSLDITGSGHQVTHVGLDALGGVRRDDEDPADPLYLHSGDRFRIFTTPTS